jgi:hypothetical protein
MEACLMSEVAHPLPASIRSSSTRHTTPRLGGRASLHDIHARENNSFAVEVGEMEQQFLRPNEERHLNVELTSANDNVVQRAREELVTSPHGLLAARMEWSTKPRHSNQPFGNWADNLAAALVRMEPRKISDDPFEGIISRVDAAPIQISLVKATKHTMLRLHSHIVGGTDDLCLINLQLEGLSRTTQRGQEQVSAPGDLAVADTTEPYEITNRRDFKLFCFAVPRPLLPSGFFGRPWLNLSMTDIGRALSRTLAGYAELCLNSPPGVGVPAPIGGQVMDLISHALDLLADAPAERAIPTSARPLLRRNLTARRATYTGCSRERAVRSANTSTRSASSSARETCSIARVVAGRLRRSRSLPALATFRTSTACSSAATAQPRASFAGL